ncbi:ABC transporter substrate-binding protein [Cupriavidus gilardii]|uniref:ABC transporter substrate-binding protein n=1 Tax=Cupriavidus gilardii TaxID=82541 RepID=A0A849B4T4_9BURK|nr:ABC transporter substrate-binding protein [Cupriavidus gilardii]KAB0597462.1 ABC transporter substrate-binding protein [Cupriavidus gilardii]MCT9014433.1 ABC transporter substrate-binding protein [Cupriavidus gilardii]MCT9054153.1 ABC transporter substrate-binding protein [Cupriavidus gilardii]NNH10192.1 ABC transporter substrate-binding protein [Cupriavidus gilardii]WNG68429.1 ABC transporter substrate-binding protein [Cupriavidus gilardii]
MSQRQSPSDATPTARRRDVLRLAGAAAIAAPALMLGRRAWCAPRKLTFAWNQNSFCLTPIVVAQEKGFFEKNGLQVDLINYSGSTDQLLESIATGKADAAVGMIHRWLKPLEAGFDVKIIGSSHGGCVRLVGAKAAGVTSLQALKGKTVGVSDLAAPGKHFFTILLAKNGIDPDKDVTWRQYPADLLGVAVDKGEIQAIADGDPNLYLLEKRTNGAYVELATNLTGEYARKVCCVVGARGELVRNDRPTASALARAIVQATDFVHENPNEAAKVFAKYSPKISLDDLRKLYATLTYTHHPTGVDLRDEIAFYADDFRKIGVIKKTTDPQRLAQHVYANVLG